MEKKINGYLLKDGCVSCGYTIPLTWGRFYSNGNFCQNCCSKAANRSFGRLKRLKKKNK